MHLIDSVWTSITKVTSLLTLSPFTVPGGEEQVPFLVPSEDVSQASAQGPVFKPPSGRIAGPGSDFTCDYSSMVGFSNCSTPDNRGCWLRNSSGFEYNINTNYEDVNQTPLGVTRNYVLDLAKHSVNVDGLDFPEGKIFNESYPGPWIQACWGDVCTKFLYSHNSCPPLMIIRHTLVLTRLADCQRYGQK